MTTKIHYLLHYDSILKIGWRQPPKFDLPINPDVFRFYVNCASLAGMTICAFTHLMKSLFNCPNNVDCPPQVIDDFTRLVFDAPDKCRHCLEEIKKSIAYLKLEEYIANKYASFLEVAPSGTNFFNARLFAPSEAGLREIAYTLNAIFSQPTSALAPLVDESDNFKKAVNDWYIYLRGGGVADVEPDAILNVVSNLPVIRIDHVVPSPEGTWGKPAVVAFPRDE